MTPSPRLVMSQGPQPGQTFVLSLDTLTVGRDPGNDIVINDPQISRHHARITRQGNLLVLEDVGSTNGTFANGMRLTSPHTLVNGDVINLGDAVTLTYHGVSIAPAEPPGARSTIPLEQQSYRPPSPPSYTPASPPLSYAPVPPPAYAAAPPPIEPYEQPVPQKKSKTWLFAGCGCLVLLVILACVAMFVLDYLRLLPPVFYEPLRWLGLI